MLAHPRTIFRSEDIFLRKSITGIISRDPTIQTRLDPGRFSLSLHLDPFFINGHGNCGTGIDIYPKTSSFRHYTPGSIPVKTMRSLWYTGVLLLVLLIPVVAAQTTGTISTAASQVSVTNVVLEPRVLIEGDQGLLTLEVTNTGSQSVPLGVAYLFSNGITAVNGDAYQSLGTLGAGNRLNFTFTINADVTDGIYYPIFSLGFREPGSDSLRFPIPVKVESSGLQLSVIQVPDTFSSGKTDAITLLVGNPRENTLNGIVIVPQGEGINFTQKSYFVGDLLPGGSSTVIFNITPSVPTNLNFTALYRNGMNDHFTTVTMSIVFGTDKTRADPVVNNFQLTQAGGVYTLTGDVTNAGLSDARGVVVTVGLPARAVDPNPVSPIGSLLPDDLSSFEISFTASNLTEVPLLITYKDVDGNEFTKSVPVNIDGGTLTGASTGSSRNQGLFGPGSLLLPLIVFAAVAVVVYVVWKKGLFRRKARK
jgi:hypothetical protein